MHSTHGTTLDLEEIRQRRMLAVMIANDAPFEAVQIQEETTEMPVDFLFPALADGPANRLPDGPTTVAALVRLGNAMTGSREPGSAIPPVYTYLGQFIDHDITLTACTAACRDIDQAQQALPRQELVNAIANMRSPFFDLDSVYHAAPRDPLDQRFLKLGQVLPSDRRPPSKDDEHDLPRNQQGIAQIGDRRNDENLILAQLHVAFLRFHNAIVLRNNCTFEEAKLTAQQHYQHIVIVDYLKRVCDQAVLQQILQQGRRYFRPEQGRLFTPIEFSAAAFRFGHSMVRSTYNNYNSIQGSVMLLDLFRFTHGSGQIGETGSERKHALPASWIIEWENFVATHKRDSARSINTHLAKPLVTLSQEDGRPLQGIFRQLAVRNLLRGFLFGLPTGQSLVRHIWGEVMVLREDQLLHAAKSADEKNALRDGEFLHKTPLWYYILAEADVYHQGSRLGPLGTLLVAETILGFIKITPDSIPLDLSWQPTLPGVNGHFNLPDLLRFAGVLS